MSDNAQQQFQDELNHIYATLNQHDVEQFYADYQLWYTRQRITTLQEQIGSLHQQISENAERLQQVQPPAVAFATLARLQAKGVNDIDLLDRMLERGEEWLDLTMQRLDYCEQLDFIHDNYAQWCEHALEGAYDWIDSMRDAYADTTQRPAVTTEVDEDSVEATEELLIQKLASEEEREEEASSVEITLKQPAVPLSPSVPATEEKPPEPGLQGSPEEEPVAALETQEAGLPQELPLHEPEMAFPVVANVEADADTSLVSAEQAAEDEYVEFVSPSQASPYETPPYQEEKVEIYLPEVEPQELATPLPAEEGPTINHDTCPPGSVPTVGPRFIVGHSIKGHVDLISTPEASLPAEAAPTADASPIPLVDQITSPEHVEPSSLPENSHLNTPAGTEFAATDMEREEPILSRVDITHDQIDSQASRLEESKPLAQEVK
ncbi:MAG TPA: hypothetical protein VFN02_03855, partial [Ktedonobacteraceae bacterium]|nr:hypothetical protein [Ktedonobacteraceae bacterium]